MKLKEFFLAYSIISCLSILTCNAGNRIGTARHEKLLFDSVIKGSLPGVQAAIIRGAVGAKKNLALQLAASNKNWLIAAYLIKHGADRSVLTQEQQELTDREICHMDNYF